MRDDKKFCEYSLIPDILKETQLFDSQIEQILYKPIDNRSTASFRTAIKTKLPKTSEIFLQQRPKTTPNNPETILQITPQESAQSQSSSSTFKLQLMTCRIDLTFKVARQDNISMSRDPTTLQPQIYQKS